MYMGITTTCGELSKISLLFKVHLSTLVNVYADLVVLTRIAGTS